MRKMLAVAALAGLTIATSLIATTGQADAQFRRWGPALGIGIAAGVVTGAIIANSGPVYVDGRCGWLRQYDRFGNYLGRTWVCQY
ncbi:MAG: hypothetical protein IT536_12250 [Hyphomicrobiales bacterium]|nr:hypothetical protein [Hyphomicrobiales bacterium]